MIKSSFGDICISGIASAVSSKWVPVEEFAVGMNEEDIKRFKKNTGVNGRYDANENQTAADFCYAAAKTVIEHEGIDPLSVGLLVFVTQLPDYKYPGNACVLHGRLGLSENCLAFDVNLGCSGLVYGLNIVCSIMETSNIKNALLLVGDTCGKSRRREIINGYTDASDNDAKLFGDAGSAILLKKDKNTSKIDITLRTDGTGYQMIISRGGGERYYGRPDVLKMESIDVFNFAIEKAPSVIKELMESIGRSPEDYDCLVLHQANHFMMKQIAKRSGFDTGQNLISIDEYGNTSGASIAVTLSKQYGEDTDGEIRAMLCGYGIGLSWGAVSLTIEKKNILPIIQTDEYFDDGYKI